MAKKGMANMTKQDLKPGMIVELRNGKLYMVHDFEGNFILANEDDWLHWYDFDNNLYDKEFRDFDIVKIRKPVSVSFFANKNWLKAPIIFDRTTLTEQEIHLLLALDNKWKYIAKDKDGSVLVYEGKPNKSECCWNNNLDYQELNNFNSNLKFSCISWEDDEPTSLDELRDILTWTVKH